MGLNVFMRSQWLENTPKFCIIKVFMVICLPDNFSIAVFGLRGGRGLRGRRPLVGGKLKAPFGAGVTF